MIHSHFRLSQIIGKNCENKYLIGVPWIKSIPFCSIGNFVVGFFSAVFFFIVIIDCHDWVLQKETNITAIILGYPWPSEISYYHGPSFPCLWDFGNESIVMLRCLHGIDINLHQWDNSLKMQCLTYHQFGFSRYVQVIYTVCAVVGEKENRLRNPTWILLRVCLPCGICKNFKQLHGSWCVKICAFLI